MLQNDDIKSLQDEKAEILAAFVVSPAQDNMSAGAFLRSCGVSLSCLRRVKFTPQGICADGVRITTATPVRSGQTITLPRPQETSTAVLAQDIPLKIVYEDDYAMVVEKPAGMAVHPTLNAAAGTLANAYLGELQRRGKTGVFRPVYRLDRDTTGLLLVAKDSMSASFLQHNCQKTYYAVVEGHLPQSDGSIRLPIARAKNSIILRCVDPAGAYARTDYSVLQQNDRYSLVKCHLLTGRTHQIRVHMAALGCPLAGDELYGGHRDAFLWQALHCGRLTFTPPQGVAITLQSAFPPEFSSVGKFDCLVK